LGKYGAQVLLNRIDSFEIFKVHVVSPRSYTQAPECPLPEEDLLGSLKPLFRGTLRPVPSAGGRPLLAAMVAAQHLAAACHSG
jgi:hypothetical protein